MGEVAHQLQQQASSTASTTPHYHPSRGALLQRHNTCRRHCDPPLFQHKALYPPERAFEGPLAILGPCVEVIRVREGADETWDHTGHDGLQQSALGATQVAPDVTASEQETERRRFLQTQKLMPMEHGSARHIPGAMWVPRDMDPNPSSQRHLFVVILMGTLHSCET